MASPKVRWERLAWSVGWEVEDAEGVLYSGRVDELSESAARSVYAAIRGMNGLTWAALEHQPMAWREIVSEFGPVGQKRAVL
jgi:hypothetical protein